MINFEEDRVDSVTQIDQTKTLSDKVIELRNLEDQVAASEDHTRGLKEKARELSQVVIPKMMQEMNITKLKLKDGAQIEVTNFYSAKINSEKQDEAFNWLRDNGLGDIIKNDITVTFGQGEENKALAYATLAKGQGFEPAQKEAVHAMTLKVTMEDWKNKGNEVPEDLFWTFDGNQTKIKGKK